MAQGQTLTGTLLERGTRKPLAGVSVFILPQKTKAITDESGRFQIEVSGEPAIFNWIVNAAGYKRLEEPDQLTNPGPRTLYLEKDSYLVYETTIVSQQKKRHDTAKTIKREDFLSAPGSGGDPVKAVQNLSGINRPQSFSSQVLIQGSGPQDTKYALDGHEIPLVFHFGGLTSVVIPEAIDRVETLFAGYGPESGRANGGWVGLWTREPQVDRMHGLAFMDLFNAGGLVEGPLLTGADQKPGGYLLSVRKSYFGSVLRKVFKNNENFNLTVAPEYSDLTFLYQIKLTDRDDFKSTFSASEDSLGFLLKEPVKSDPAFRGDFSSSTAFFRWIPQWTHTHGPNTVSRHSLGVGKDWISFLNGENYFRLESTAITVRSELEHRWDPVIRSFFGIDTRHRFTDVELSIPTFYSQGGVNNPLSSGVRQRADVTSNNSVIGVYAKNEIQIPETPWTLLPNLRLDWFEVTGEALLSPRPGARYKIDDSLTLRSSGGLYTQPPLEQEVSDKFGNPDLSSPRAWHLTAGAEKDFRGLLKDGWTLNGDLFLKELVDQVIPSSSYTTRNGQTVPERYTNQGRGRVVGMQTQAKFLSGDWSTQISYTLSQSRRWSPGQSPAPSQYDQTHLLGVLGSVELGRNWRLGGRFRYATGNPNTPVTDAILDTDNDVYIPVRGAIYSERFDDFYQLDLRVDKKWIFDTWILSLYFDVQNVTNRKNFETIQYAYDYSKKTPVSGLPLLPTLGLKGEF